MKKTAFFIVAILVFFVAAASLVEARSLWPFHREKEKAVTISTEGAEVIDGDTLKLPNGQLLRLIGVDCPELEPTGEDKRQMAQEEIPTPAYEGQSRVAKDYVTEYLKHHSTRAVTDPLHKAADFKDHNERTMVYVYAGDQMLNQTLVRQGVCLFEPEVRFEYYNKFQKAEAQAQKAKRGIWEKAAS